MIKVALNAIVLDAGIRTDKLPVQNRCSRVLYIRTVKCMRNKRGYVQVDTLMDKRIVVAIDGWDADSRYPNGHYVRTLGTIGDRDTETDVLLLENDINTQPFTQAVHDCVPPLPWSVTEADVCEPNRWGLILQVLQPHRRSTFSSGLAAVSEYASQISLVSPSNGMQIHHMYISTSLQRSSGHCRALLKLSGNLVFFPNEL